jgi:hypothetical protein
MKNSRKLYQQINTVDYRQEIVGLNFLRYFLLKICIFSHIVPFSPMKINTFCTLHGVVCCRMVALILTAVKASNSTQLLLLFLGSCYQCLAS